jgi:hypothetical protein
MTIPTDEAGYRVWLERFLNPQTKIGLHRRHALILLYEHRDQAQLPTSGRFLMYEAEQRGWVTKEAAEVKPGKKMARRPGQDFGDAIRDLRSNGLVPWAWIVDETRVLEEPFVHGSVAEHLLAILDPEAKRLLLDPWAPGRRPMVLCESRSLMGVLRAVLREYRVSFAATNGQAGGFLHTNVVPALKAGDHVLYLGDYDLAGVAHIEANTRRVLERELKGNLQWERLALTPAQIADPSFTLSPITKKDNRFKGDTGVHDAYECEALSQRVIVDLVRSRLDELLPAPLADVLERQRTEADRLRPLIQ